MSIFQNWKPNEMAALRRATARLRAQQPRDLYIEPTLPGCSYVSTSGYYRIEVVIGTKKYYCGSLRQWDEKAARAMQEQKILDHGPKPETK